MSNDDDDDKRDSAPDESDSSDESSASEASETEAKRTESADDDTSSETESSASSSTSSTSAKAEPASSAAAGSRMSAGARLAAAKAAKAVVKASKKEERKAATQTEVTQGTEADAPVAEAAPEDPVKELEESELGRAALRAGKWWESNQQIGWIALAVAAIGIVGFLGWRYQEDTSSAAVGVMLEDAIEIASARVVPEGEEPAATDDEDEDEDAEDERTFPTRAARSEAALEAYQAIVAQHGDHASAGIARLGAARALLALGRNDEAEAMYQEAFDRNGRSGVIAWQALEGVGFAQEAAGNPTEAQSTYERLGNLEDHAYEQVANYHLARLMLSRGERDEARTALRELVDSLRADTLEGSSEPRFPYLLSQAEVRLRELDPSSATSAGPSLLGPGGGPGGGGLQLGGGEGGDIDPEQLQQLIRQFQERQQQGGGGAGGEGGGE